MAVIENTTLKTLREGRLALGMIVRLAVSAEIPKIAKACDHDFIFVDMQHGAMSIESTLVVCQAALDTGVTPLVRVPSAGLSLAARLLDNGAMGIIVPDVETAEQAGEVVRACRFAPLGRRSVASGYAQLGYGAYSTAEATRLMNAQTLLVLMIESGRGIANVDAIAAVPGFDVLHIGSNDLLTEMGLAAEMGKPKHIELCERVMTACRANGKFFGIGGVRAPDLQARLITMGAQFMTTNTDLAFLMSAAGERARALRAIASEASR